MRRSKVRSAERAAIAAARASGKAEGFAEGVSAAKRIARTMPWCKECLATDQMVDELEKIVPMAEATPSEPATACNHYYPMAWNGPVEVCEKCGKAIPGKVRSFTGDPAKDLATDFSHKDKERGPSATEAPDAAHQLAQLLTQAGAHPYVRADLMRAMKAEQERDDAIRSRNQWMQQVGATGDICDQLRSLRDKAERERDELRAEVSRLLAAHDAEERRQEERIEAVRKRAEHAERQRDELAEALRPLLPRDPNQDDARMAKARAALARLEGK